MALLSCSLHQVASMPMPSSAVHDHIVREPAPAELETNETPIAIACEPPGVPDGAGARGTMFIRLKAGTTPISAKIKTDPNRPPDTVCAF